jgi:cell division protein ZapD
MYNPDDGLIYYELPLAERVRRLLRIEILLDKAAHAIQQTRSPWESRQAIIDLVELQEIVTGGDIKAELINELERHSTYLDNLRRHEAVAQDELQAVLDQLQDVVVRLRTLAGQPGQLLRDEALLSAVRQRMSLPGGICGFDIPCFSYWLSRPVSMQQDHLQGWFAHFDLLEEAVKLILHLIRETGMRLQRQAEHGTFQWTVDKVRSWQLIRVGIDIEATVFPEITGSRHRIVVRFMDMPDVASKPRQVEQQVPFILCCCGF